MAKNIEAVAKEADLSPNTIRTWEKSLGIKFKRNSQGNRIFFDEDIDLIKSIKGLRDNGSGFRTITQKLNLNVSNIQPENTPNTDKSNDTDNQLNVSNIDMNVGNILPEYNLHVTKSFEYLTEKIEGLQDSFSSISEMAKTLVNSSLELGELRTEKKYLEQKVKEQEDKINLITGSNIKDLAGLQKEIDKLKMDHESHQEKVNGENERLKAELDQEKKKSFWKKLFG